MVDSSIKNPLLLTQETPIWVLCGKPGTGKSSLFNALTNQKRETGNRARALTTEQDTLIDIMSPVYDRNKLRYFCDSQGIGDATVKTVEDLEKQLAPPILRLLKGATGIVLCMDHDRVLFQDALIIRTLIQLCTNLPIVICCTRADRLDNWTKDAGKLWLDQNKDDIAISFDCTASRFSFVSLSNKNGVDPYCKVLEDTLSNFDHVAWADGGHVDEVRNKSKIKQSITVNKEEMDILLQALEECIDFVERSPWWVELLKGIPVIGTIVTVIDAIRTALSKPKKAIIIKN